MTKRILIAAGGLLLTAALLLLCFLPTPKADENAPSSSVWIPGSTTTILTHPSSSTTRPTSRPTTVPTSIPSTTPPPTTTAPTAPTTTPPPTTTLPPRAGQVRLYTCDRERLDVYAQWAVAYYQTVGIEVILQTPREGQSCAEALAEYMEGDYPPTMFCIHTQQDLQKWQHLLFDMNGTAAAQQLYTSEFAMHSGGRMLALPVAVDWFGYVYNAEKLAMAFSRDDLVDHASMDYITKYITSQQIYPFAKPDFSDISDAGLAALLRMAFDDEAQLRSVVDLYIGNSYNTADAMATFQQEKIIFYPGSTACLENALQLGIHKLELLPMFAADRDAMTYFSSYFWGVNASGYSLDVVETLAFFSWLVISQNDQPAPIDLLDLLSPYVDAAVADNALEKLLRKYMQEESVVVRWDTRADYRDDRADFCAALALYYKNPSDTTWAEVKKYL